MKIYSLVSLFSASLLWIACGSGPKTPNTETATTDTNTVKTESLPLPRVWEIKTSTGKKMVATETHPKGASLSNIKIQFQGDSTGALSFTDVDPISSAVTADLDKNGFDELYLVSTSVGTGSYGNIIGVSSNRDKSLSYIFVPEMDPNDLKPGKLFDGYEGHDRYAIEHGTLIRRFPIKGDTNNLKSINYQVMLGEGGLILAPKRK